MGAGVFSGFGTVLMVLMAIVIYFLPAILASKKKHAQAIGALNLLLGWTLIGWVGALVWAVSDVESKACAFCAEPINLAAQICRHCGKDQPAVVPFMSAPAPVAPAPPPAAPRPALRDVSANTSRCEGCGANVPKYRAEQHRCAAMTKAK